MKDHVGDMEGHMDNLTGNVEKIRESSNQVDKHLGNRREKLEGMTEMHSLLTQV